MMRVPPLLVSSEEQTKNLKWGKKGWSSEMISFEGIRMSCKQVMSWVVTREANRLMTLAFLPVKPPGAVNPRELMLLNTTEGRLVLDIPLLLK